MNQNGKTAQARSRLKIAVITVIAHDRKARPLTTKDTKERKGRWHPKSKEIFPPVILVAFVDRYSSRPEGAHGRTD
jgi:hypothetical protein